MILVMNSNRPIKFVASGFASPADDFAQQALDLNQYLVKHSAATFFMRNEGNNNKKYGIYSGDILVIDRSLKPDTKHLSLIIYENEFRVASYLTLKRFLRGKGLNTEFWGVVTAIIRKF